jgi:hypothetical protein
MKEVQMQRWELTRVWVPLELETRQGEDPNWSFEWREHGKEAGEALARANELAGKGWELAAVMPQLQSDVYFRDGSGVASTCERGYLMFFKRPLS